jgi:hypothetical protein
MPMSRKMRKCSADQIDNTFDIKAEIVEPALILPAICHLIFSAPELMKINMPRGAGNFLRAEENIGTATANRFTDGTGSSSGKVLVLIFVCCYVFFGASVKGLLSGKSNITGNSDTSGSICSEESGVGVVN